MIITARHNNKTVYNVRELFRCVLSLRRRSKFSVQSHTTRRKKKWYYGNWIVSINKTNKPKQPLATHVVSICLFLKQICDEKTTDWLEKLDLFNPRDQLTHITSSLCSYLNQFTLTSHTLIILLIKMRDNMTISFLLFALRLSIINYFVLFLFIFFNWNWNWFNIKNANWI